MPRPTIDGERIHVILTRQQIKKLRAYSRKTGLPLSELMRRAADVYLGGIEKQAQRAKQESRE